MQIAVCDDEKEIRTLLGNWVRTLCPEADLRLYETGEALLAQEHQPDILLLDIQMPHMDGMDAAKALRCRKKDLILIFVTASEEHVFQAFDVGAFHYLVKPFTREKFETVLRKAQAQYQDMLETRQSRMPGREEKYIIIRTGAAHVKIYLKDIVYAEVFNRKVLLHTVDGQMEYYGKLSDLEKQLGEDFFRPHRAYLIHFKYVLRYNASAIELEHGTALMARQKYPEFVKRYMKYNQKSGLL